MLSIGICIYFCVSLKKKISLLYQILSVVERDTELKRVYNFKSIFKDPVDQVFPVIIRVDFITILSCRHLIGRRVSIVP